MNSFPKFLYQVTMNDRPITTTRTAREQARSDKRYLEGLMPTETFKIVRAPVNIQATTHIR